MFHLTIEKQFKNKQMKNPPTLGAVNVNEAKHACLKNWEKNDYTK
jgi:hypothetical protein